MIARGRDVTDRPLDRPSEPLDRDVERASSLRLVLRNQALGTLVDRREPSHQLVRGEAGPSFDHVEGAVEAPQELLLHVCDEREVVQGLGERVQRRGRRADIHRTQGIEINAATLLRAEQRRHVTVLHEEEVGQNARRAAVSVEERVEQDEVVVKTGCKVDRV